MHIVIDTNILISAAFYAGFVKKFLDDLDAKNFTVCGNSKIIEEYYSTKDKMISKKLGKFNAKIFDDFVSKIENFKIISDLKVCRDKKDDKFISFLVSDLSQPFIIYSDFMLFNFLLGIWL